MHLWTITFLAVVLTYSLASAEECVPGSHYKNLCNYCYCTSDGLAACTRAKCENPEQTSVDGESYRKKREHQVIRAKLVGRLPRDAHIATVLNG